MFTSTAYANDTIAVQESEGLPKAPEQPATNMLTSMLPMVLIFAVMYFLLIRPNDKRRRQQEQLVGSVKKGEEVLTSSGIFGVVSKINDNDNTVEIEVAKDLQIKILKSAIADITSRKKEDAQAPKAVEKSKEKNKK